MRTPMLAATAGPPAVGTQVWDAPDVADWLVDRMSRPMLTPEQVAETVCELLVDPAHNGVAWKIEVDPDDSTGVGTTVL